MKKSLMTVAAFAMVLTFSSCKETTEKTTEETLEEASAINATEETIPAEEVEMEEVIDTTSEVDTTEMTPADMPESGKE